MTAPIPTKPKFTLPPNSCDCHCHIFGPASRFPVVRASPSEDPAATIETLETAHSILGIERVVLVHTPAHGTDHAIILDAMDKNPERYRGVGRAAPDITDEELADLNARGMRGLRYEFLKHFGEPPSLEMIARMAERIAPLGWHLVFLLDGPDLIEMASFIRSLPVPVVIDHMGRVNTANGIDHPEFVTLLDLLKDDKIWIKVSGSTRVSATGAPYEDVIPLARQIVEAAPDRTIWGTDWPHPGAGPGNAPDDGALVDLMAQFTDDDTSLHKILVHNPARLYGFNV